MLLFAGALILGCSGEIVGGDKGGGGGGGTADASGGGSGGGGSFDAGANLPDALVDDGSDMYLQARIDCVDRINAFRATEGKPPYQRWTEQEACSDGQAKLDGDSNTPHGNFSMCGENAQNTCPNWPSTGSVTQGCLQQMWDEGPGEPFSEHGHYINMSSSNYSKVACGFYELPGGGIWASQNFQ